VSDAVEDGSSTGLPRLLYGFTTALLRFYYGFTTVLG